MVDRNKEHLPHPDSPEGLAWRGIEPPPSSLSGKAPTAQQIEAGLAARERAAFVAELIAAPQRAAGELNRQESEARARDEREEHLLERGY